MPRKGLHIAIFISFSGHGGVERMITNLSRGFLKDGYNVDMVIARAKGEHLASIPGGVRQIRLNTRHTITALPGLVRYIKQNRPSALLAAKDRGIKVAVLARILAGFKGRLIGRIGTTVSEAISGKGIVRQWIWYTGMRLFYSRVDRIVAVSEGVASDIRTITGLPPSSVVVITNPVVSSELLEKSREAVDHPWFESHEVPVIMGIGRLTDQKDFVTLIRAFARTRETTSSRLIILGEGKERGKLQSLIETLRITDDVSMPGFVSNPYPWLANSSLFVLSSKWEGSPNVLTEALALGVPVVSTNCRSGPEEILQKGKYGELVDVGDWEELAGAMNRALRDPFPPDFLQEAAAGYTVGSSSRKYLELLVS